MIEAIPVGNLRWMPHHTWVNNETDRVDGYFEGIGLPLDIATVSDNCCVTDIEAAEAKKVWDSGRVLIGNTRAHGAPTLVVPTTALNDTLINEALRRYMP